MVEADVDVSKGQARPRPPSRSLGFVTKHSPGNYSALTPTHQVVWCFMIEVDVDVSKGQAKPRLASRLLLPLYL